MKQGKRIAACVLCGALLFCSGCGSKGEAVYVQSVAGLQAVGGIAPGDRFAGLVVSEKVSEIKRDKEKNIEELLVREGDDVKEGQALFSYDTEQLQLTLDKQRLQLQQLETSIENYEQQIAKMERDSKNASTREKLQYTIQIQTTQVDLKEAELNLKTKEAEVKKSEDLLENATIVSPVTGRVTSISESGTDSSGKELPYITIQQTGSYRVKGTINELQRGGLMEGDRIRMESRTDPSQFWMGTVTVVDYENPTQGSDSNMFYGMGNDEMSSSSHYPFYVELDSSDGLLLGQHLYLSISEGEGNEPEGLILGSAFICFEDNGDAFVWADNGRGKLEKRSVSLGEYDPMRDTYAVLSGLEESDYVTFPDENAKAGAPTTKTQIAAEGGAVE